MATQNHELQTYPDVPCYPTAQRYETLDGPVVIEDHYEWLRLHDTDPEAAEVIAAQNEYTDNYLESIGSVQAVYERLEQLTNGDTKYTIPSLYDNSITWWQRSPDQQQWMLMRMPHDADEAEVVIDPNLIGEGVSVAEAVYSPDESHLIYTLTQSGDEIPQAYIRNEQTDEVQHFYTGKVFEFDWDKDGKSFAYTKSCHDEYDGSNMAGYQRAYRHALDGEFEDILIFDPQAHDLPASTWLGVQSSHDSDHTIISAWLSRQDVRQYFVNNQTLEATELLAGTPAAHHARVLDGYVYITTTLGADNKRVIRATIEEADKPAEEWEQFLPERQDQQFKQLKFTKDYAIVEYTQDTASIVELRDRKTGDFIKNLDMPALSNIASLSTSRDRSDFFYSISNCLTLETAYHFDGETSEMLWQDSRSMDPEKVQATQEWCTLPDGSRQPMFIMAPKGGLRDQPRPVWLEGYGGFANGNYPRDCYDDLRRIWVESGGIAIAPCLPGGDEFGRQWHEKARGANRPVAFDGMISAIEHAINTGITTPETVALSGGSNGGLMALAVAMKRPDLVKVVNPRVPLTDMYNFPNHLIGSIWTSEFGDPRKAEEFAWLSYSPYHNFDPTVDYPGTFITTSIRDTRVHPIHSLKMAALMQTGSSTGPILLRADAESGHAASKGISHRLRGQAERLAFLMHGVGLELAVPEVANA